MKDYSVPLSPGRRAAAYWFADGLPDIVFGLILLLSGGLAAVWRVSTPAPAARFYLLILAVGFIFYWSLERRIVDLLKSQFTYPRTGYARPPEDSEGPRQKMVTLSIEGEPAKDDNVTSFRRNTVSLIWWFFYFVSTFRDPPAIWMTPFSMPVLALALFAATRKSDHPYRARWLILLGLSGLLFLWLNMPSFFQPLLPAVLAGGWFTLYGVKTFFGYLRANPYPVAPEVVRS